MFTKFRPPEPKVRGSNPLGDINHTDDPPGDIKNAHVVRGPKPALVLSPKDSGLKVC